MKAKETLDRTTRWVGSGNLPSAPTGDWGWYLYGVTRRRHPWEPELSPCDGLDGKPVQTFMLGKLVPIVSRVPLDKLRNEAVRAQVENADSVAGWLEKMVRGHERVVEAVHREHGILPAKFGCVYASVLDLKVALKQAHDALLARLQFLEGCDEWGVRLYADRPSMLEFATAKDPESRRIEKDLASAGPGRAYFLQRKLAEALDAATDQASADLAQAGYDHLTHHTRAGRINPLSNRRGPSETDVEVLRADFLVPRQSADAFVEEVHYLTESREKLRSEYSGPWPPYNFVTLDEQALR